MVVEPKVCEFGILEADGFAAGVESGEGWSDEVDFCKVFIG